MSRFEKIYERIDEKKADYGLYDFSKTEDNAFKTFFDLAQEFDDIEDFYCLCVAIPKGFFGLDARLYISDSERDEPALAATTTEELDRHAGHVLSDFTYCTPDAALVLPIKGKRLRMSRLFKQKAGSSIMGFIEVFPASGLDAHRMLFFEKYANRIGFNLHNRFLVVRNIEHLNFIRALVADIEHNIIVPNMVYKLLLKNLKDKIAKSRQIGERLDASLSGGEAPPSEDLRHSAMALDEVNQGLEEEYAAIEKHYQNMSLFLETLLRRGHFDEGRLVLRKKPCNVKKEVVEPQLAQYLERFNRMGISVDDRLSGIPDEDTISVADVGLLSQVYANLFSNALKYTQEATTSEGAKIKYVSYGREVIRDFFGPGLDGVKYNVFSTGPHISPDEHERIFEEGYRGRDVLDRPGTGHGLSFIKNVISLHGGVAGYEPTRYGNNFYFILPA